VDDLSHSCRVPIVEYAIYLTGEEASIEQHRTATRQLAVVPANPPPCQQFLTSEPVGQKACAQREPNWPQDPARRTVPSTSGTISNDFGTSLRGSSILRRLGTEQGPMGANVQTPSYCLYQLDKDNAS
jgi:hypothetical protein